MIIIKKFIQTITILSSLVLYGCPSDPDEPEQTSLTGVFTTPVVNGLKYTTTSKSGYTDSSGTFEYEDGEIIRFYIGDIFVGESYAKNIVTPLDLSADASAAQTSNLQRASNINDNWAINLFNLLLSLDPDGDASNGIEITATVTTAATSITLNLDLPPADFITDTVTQTFTTTLSVTLTQPADVSTFISTNYSGNSDWGSMVWGTSSWNNQ